MNAIPQITVLKVKTSLNEILTELQLDFDNSNMISI